MKKMTGENQHEIALSNRKSGYSFPPFKKFQVHHRAHEVKCTGWNAGLMVLSLHPEKPGRTN